MSTLKNKLEYVNETKRLIGDAIISKGGTIGNDFRGYANSILNIPTGGSELKGVDFKRIGYTDIDTEKLINMTNESIDLSEDIAKLWDQLHFIESKNSFFGYYVKLKFETSGEDITLQWCLNRFVFCPSIDLSELTNMGSFFSGCYKLKYISLLNTRSATRMGYMFKDCTSLETIQQLYTGRVIEMGGMFEGCTSLETIPLIDTSLVTRMEDMFLNCVNLKTIPLINTSLVTHTQHMFEGCTSLETIPLIDTSLVKYMSWMFNGCKSLKSIPKLNTSKVEGMYGTFYHCYKLKVIPPLDTRNVISMNETFGYTNIEKISELSFDSLQQCENIFSHNSRLLSLNIKFIGSDRACHLLDLSDCKYLGLEHVENGDWISGTYPEARKALIDTLLTNSYDRVSKYFEKMNIKLNSNVKNRLTPEEITAIEKKGYTLTFV